LIMAGIYSSIAIPLKGGPWRSASMIMIAKALTADLILPSQMNSSQSASSTRQVRTRAERARTLVRQQTRTLVRAVSRAKMVMPKPREQTKWKLGSVKKTKQRSIWATSLSTKHEEPKAACDHIEAYTSMCTPPPSAAKSIKQVAREPRYASTRWKGSSWMTNSKMSKKPPKVGATLEMPPREEGAQSIPSVAFNSCQSTRSVKFRSMDGCSPAPPALPPLQHQEYAPPPGVLPPENELDELGVWPSLLDTPISDAGNSSDPFTSCAPADDGSSRNPLEEQRLSTVLERQLSWDMPLPRIGVRRAGAPGVERTTSLERNSSLRGKQRQQAGEAGSSQIQPPTFVNWSPSPAEAKWFPTRSRKNVGFAGSPTAAPSADSTQRHVLDTLAMPPGQRLAPSLQLSPQPSPQPSLQLSPPPGPRLGPHPGPQPDPRLEAEEQQLSPEMAPALATLMGKLEAANITSITREVALQYLRENAGNIGKAFNRLKRDALPL